MIEVPFGRRKHIGGKFFRWGVYFQLRRDLRWYHLTIKCFREWSFGKTGQRYGIWIGWWATSLGERGGASGIRFSIERIRRYHPGPRSVKLRSWYPRHRNERET